MKRSLSATPAEVGPSSRSSSTPPRSLKRLKESPPLMSLEESLAAQEYGPEWLDWPAPRDAMAGARAFIHDIIANNRSVLIIPDKDADGLSSGTLLFKTLCDMGLSPDRISVQHLVKGENVHTDAEKERMEGSKADCAIVLDQGSRPGAPLLEPTGDGRKRVLIIDHHFSHEWPDDSQVLTACHSPPIVTTSLLTYLLLRGVNEGFVKSEGWRAVVGVVGDLGPNVAKWGRAPWPSELGQTSKQVGMKNISDAVAAVNAPRRTAEYNVPRAWQIFLAADRPQDVANNAFLKLCKIDVTEATLRWARTPPKFSLDGRIALITIDTGFQIHPVIATRWSGTLGRKSSKLIMVMCANVGYNPNPEKVSFSCRIAASLRSLPDAQRPDLIQLLKDIGAEIPGFLERVGDNYARGHKEATGGIIPKVEFDLMINHLGIGAPRPKTASPKTPKKTQASATSGSILNYFQPQAEAKPTKV